MQVRRWSLTLTLAIMVIVPLPVLQAVGQSAPPLTADFFKKSCTAEVETWRGLGGSTAEVDQLVDAYTSYRGTLDDAKMSLSQQYWGCSNSYCISNGPIRLQEQGRVIELCMARAQVCGRGGDPNDVPDPHGRPKPAGYPPFVCTGANALTPLPTPAVRNGEWKGQATGNRVTIEARPGGLYVALVTQNTGQVTQGYLYAGGRAGPYHFKFPDGRDSIIQVLGADQIRVTNPDGWTDVFTPVSLPPPPAAGAAAPPAPQQAPSVQLTPEQLEVMSVLDEVLGISNDGKLKPTQPVKQPPPGPAPRLIEAENQGTPCLDASLANIHRTDPPEPIADNNYWYYDIVLKNKCGYPVVWYTEIFTGPAPPPNPFSSGEGPFIYGGSGWPVWGQKPAPPSPDYRAVETFTDVPLGPGEVKTAAGVQRVPDLQPVQLWIVSCKAYAPDGRRALTMFNTGAPLSRDGRFFCAPNAVPAVRY